MDSLQKSLKEQFNKAENEILKQESEKLLASLKDATPVDTGRARDGWRFENNSIINDVEYIDELNQGTSQQAPSNFIEKTLLSKEGVKPNGIIVKSK